MLAVGVGLLELVVAAVGAHVRAAAREHDGPRVDGDVVE